MLWEHPEDVPSTLGPEQTGGSALRGSYANIDLVPPRGPCATQGTLCQRHLGAEARGGGSASMLGHCEGGVG